MAKRQESAAQVARRRPSPNAFAVTSGLLTPNERRAAHRLLADYPMAGLDTVAGFGEAAGVSAPTVLRMVAKLGFANYGSFQKALRAELAERLATPLMKGGDVALGNDRLGRFAEAVIANIRETAANVARGEFDAVVRLLADTNRPAHVLGGRFTDPLAGYFVAHLRVLRPNVRHITGGRASWLDQLLDVGKRDAVVLFDIRRYSTDLAAFAGTCRQTRRHDRADHRPMAVADLARGRPCPARACRGAFDLGFLGRTGSDRRGDPGGRVARARTESPRPSGDA